MNMLVDTESNPTSPFQALKMRSTDGDLTMIQGKSNKEHHIFCLYA